MYKLEYFSKKKLALLCYLVTQWYSLCKKSMMHIYIDAFLFTSFFHNELLHWHPPSLKINI